MFIYISRHDHLIAFFRMFGAVEYILFSSWCVFVILMQFNIAFFLFSLRSVVFRDEYKKLTQLSRWTEHNDCVTIYS